MKKLILLAICAALCLAALTVSVAAFVDIEDETTENAVATLESMGIVSGTSKTRYSPSLTLTRSQVCAMVIRAMGYENAVDSYVNQKLFTDVATNSWYAGYVNLAYKKNIISGYGNGKFGPEDEITYGQFVTIILRLLGYTESDIGKAWPADYIVFATDLEIDENVDLKANDKVNRGDAAILLYNAFMANSKGSQNEFYRTVGGYSSAVDVILLDNAADSTAGDLFAFVIGNSGAEMKYYTQKNRIPDTFVGAHGSLLLNSAGKAIGFIRDGAKQEDIIIDSAKLNGITDDGGKVYKVDASTAVISEGSLYTYGQAGYLKVNSASKQPARFYYNDEGKIAYIYLTSGVSVSETVAVVALSDSPKEELEGALALEGEYKVVKNGGYTDTAAITMYDVAYFDTMSNTLRVSDRKLTGYIEYATPALSAAETITVYGCELKVLESAWDTLAAVKLFDRVTVLLTDNNYVAAVYPATAVEAEMFAVLSDDTNSATLVGSSLVLRPSDLNVSVTLGGSLVRLEALSSEKIKCTTVGKVITAKDKVDIANGTVGGKALAPGCSIFEWGGKGHVYSLDGEKGVASSDFDAVYFADTLDETHVSYYHCNSAGLVDLVLLTDVTGNYFEYGYLSYYPEEKGIVMSEKVSYPAMTVKNDKNQNESKKYICTVAKSGGYGGIALAAYNKSYSKVEDFVRLTLLKNVSVSDFYMNKNDEWYFKIGEGGIPVSGAIKVYLAPAGKWMSGEEALLYALGSDLKLNVYYDKRPETGAQVRVIVAE